MSPLSLFLLPLLASASDLPPIDHHARHRELSRSVLSLHHPESSKDHNHHQESKRAKGLDLNPPLGGFLEIGQSGVSAQMSFLGTENTVYILDKVENNAMQVTTADGLTHPAWGTYFDLDSNTATAMSVTSNTFCAGGFSLANGTWVVFGGNQPVTYNGTAVSDTTNNPSGTNPYDDGEGGTAIRMLTPCDGGQCGWLEGGADLTMTTKRWYPTIEGLSDGSVVVLGGDQNGGYVSTFVQNSPSFEMWPRTDAYPGAVNMSFLNDTVPLNLFPISFLMASGNLFMQAAYKTILYDFDEAMEIPLPDMPYAVRVYPASAAAVMLPLTPANNYTQTILFCGGSNTSFAGSSDGGSGYNITADPAHTSCVRITPEDANPMYEDDDSLPEGRSMGQLIYLPTGEMWLGNGVGMGTAGYGSEHWSIGQSYGQQPVYSPAVYSPDGVSGTKFNRDGLSDSPHERMYHSSALLLPDGAVFVSGSNPNDDFETAQWNTSYSVEKWYPLWYSETRPEPSGFPASLGYGGEAWNLTYTPTNSSSDPGATKVVLIRTGFSTHCMNFGQRYLELATSYTQDQTSGQMTIHASQMPPNANLFQPGPAMIFLVVDGIPSIGKFITIGSGAIETQTVLPATTLPASSVIAAQSSNSSSAVSLNGSTTTNTTSGLRSGSTGISAAESSAPAGLERISLSIAIPTLLLVLALIR